jgi:hypothetical protein
MKAKFKTEVSFSGLMNMWRAKFFGESKKPQTANMKKKMSNSKKQLPIHLIPIEQNNTEIGQFLNSLPK